MTYSHMEYSKANENLLDFYIQIWEDLEDSLSGKRSYITHALCSELYKI